jgi:hypothetical protein
MEEGNRQRKILCSNPCYPRNPRLNFFSDAAKHGAAILNRQAALKLLGTAATLWSAAVFRRFWGTGERPSAFDYDTDQKGRSARLRRATFI